MGGWCEIPWEQARDTLRDEFEDLKKTKEKLEEEHKALRKHTSEKVLKHMEDQGIDVEFIQPHHMDVDTLLKARQRGVCGRLITLVIPPSQRTLKPSCTTYSL